MVKIKKEDKTFVWTLETEDDIFYFFSQDNLMVGIIYFEEKNPGKTYRCGKYNSNGEAREAYDSFMSSLTGMSKSDRKILFEKTTNISAVAGPEIDYQALVPVCHHKTTLKSKSTALIPHKKQKQSKFVTFNESHLSKKMTSVFNKEMKTPFEVINDTYKKLGLFQVHMPPVTFDGKMFSIDPVLVSQARKRVELEVSVFYPGDCMDSVDTVGADFIMISVDLKMIDWFSINNKPNPFWLFKPSIFASMNSNKKVFGMQPEPYQKMMMTHERKQPFGDSWPLLLHGNAISVKKELLVTWLKKSDNISMDDQITEFLNDWAHQIMLPSYQKTFLEVAETMYPRPFADMLKPFDCIEGEEINHSLWTHLFAALTIEPKVLYSNRLKSKFLDRDIPIFCPFFFRFGLDPYIPELPDEMQDFFVANA